MQLYPGWEDIALRLFLALVAGALIGIDRGVRGHAAGLRTTILVGLAACVAMIQADLLLATSGRAPGFFAKMDVLRMPLGILTGVGFIGAGTILRRRDLLTGVTTAATLWMITVIGLCFGGGQLWLGVAATLLSFFVLWGLHWFDLMIPRKQRAVLVIEAVPEIATIRSFVDLVAPAGYVARFYRQSRSEESQHVQLHFEISWKQPERAGPPLDLLELAGRNFRVLSLELAAELPG